MAKPISAIRNGLSVWNWLAAAHKEDTRGQAIVLIALMLIGLIAIAALVFDGGTAYAQRRRMQNAADAGAIAGARQLALGGTNNQIYDAIQEYTVTRNGAITFTATYLPGGQSIVSGGSIPPGTVTGTQVIANATFNTYFANVIGNPTGAVGAAAKASFGPAQSPTSLQPIARECTNPPGPDGMCGFQYNQSYNIWGNVPGPGNFGWLEWNGNTYPPNGAGYIADELNPAIDTLSGYRDPETDCTAIAVNCWVEGKPGVSNSAQIRTQLDEWITRGQSGTPMIIVIYDSTNDRGGGNYDYHIFGFAAFILTSYNLPAQNMTGRFIEWVTPGTPCSGCGDTGVKTLHLSP